MGTFWWVVAAFAAAVVISVVAICVRARSLNAGIARTWGHIQEQLTRRESAVRELVALARARDERALPWPEAQGALEHARKAHDSPLGASQCHAALVVRAVELVHALRAETDPDTLLGVEHAANMMVRAESRITQYRKILERLVRQNNELRASVPSGLIASTFCGCRLREFYPADDQQTADALKEAPQKTTRTES